MKQIYFFVIGLLMINRLSAQDLSKVVDQNSKAPETYTEATFKDQRIVNAQTNETSRKHTLVFNIAHRFGDMGGNSGGIHTLYGFDDASDILFSFDYGITDRLMIGVGRCKGINPMFELYNGNIKYRLVRQTEDKKVPLSVTLFGCAAVSTSKATTDTLSESSYPTFADRWSYVAQAIIARKFSGAFSLEVLPTYVHRNFVSYGDENDLFSVGVGARMKISKRFAIVADYFYTFSSFRQNAIDQSTGDKIYSAPLSVGIEIETGGHVFTINITNSTGIIENEFIPYTTSDWAKGQFRLGFNISRAFGLGGGNKPKKG